MPTERIPISLSTESCENLLKMWITNVPLQLDGNVYWKLDGIIVFSPSRFFACKQFRIRDEKENFNSSYQRHILVQMASGRQVFTLFHAN